MCVCNNNLNNTFPVEEFKHRQLIYTFNKNKIIIMSNIKEPADKQLEDFKKSVEVINYYIMSYDYLILN